MKKGFVSACLSEEKKPKNEAELQVTNNKSMHMVNDSKKKKETRKSCPYIAHLSNTKLHGCLSEYRLFFQVLHGFQIFKELICIIMGKNSPFPVGASITDRANSF